MTNRATPGIEHLDLAPIEVPVPAVIVPVDEPAGAAPISEEAAAPPAGAHQGDQP